jgi:hypothetical protein
MSGSTRIFTHETSPDLRWSRDPIEVSEYSLPPAFEAHLNLLPDKLLSIVEDIQSLRAFVEPSQSYGTGYLSVSQIDNMQASIESRLFFLQDETEARGPVAECCRLATYICCYALFTEIWNGSIIPMRLSAKPEKLLL